MSEKNQDKQVNKSQEASEEKVLTRYDLKMQKRREEKEKEKRANRRDMFIGIAVLVVLFCVVISFPIRSYMAVHETYVKIGDENVTQVEYDYNFNLVVGNYVNQYGSMLSYFGLDTSADLSTQMYTDTLTWQDFFDQMTVDNIIRSKALLREAEANGFSYDTTEDYNDYRESIEDAAAEQSMSVADFLQTSYGSLATLSRLEPYVKEAMVANAYYEHVAEGMEPSEEEIQAQYDENTDSYDSVDYRMVTVAAELPTEPTELADPVEEDTNTEDTAETTDETAETEEEAYEPSEAEIEKAMEDAYALAEEAEATVATEGELQENVKNASAVATIRDWLFDSSRQAGDTTIIANETAHSYYVLAFERRYLDETASADVRVVMLTETEELTGQSVLDEWTNGAATEESFIELVEKYSEDTTTEGGLFEAIVPTGMDEAMSAWLFDASRAVGDTTTVTASDGYTYVMYYVGANEPEWKLTIRSSLLSQAMTEYMEGIMEGVEVEDSKGNLNYLKVQALEEAIAASESAAAETESTESVETEGTETTAAE